MSEQEVVETVDPEIETAPEAGGMVPTQSREQVQDLLFFAENINAVIEAQNKIRMAILKLTHPGDWVLFNDKAEIGFAPANRIGATLGVSYTNWSAEKITGADEKGSWYRWEYQADASHGKRTIRVYGRAGSRDKFFGKKEGQFRELHDIDEGNLKMAAMRACKKEGVKDLFGLHHMDPDYLKKYGIDLGKTGGHAFKSDAQKAEEAQANSVVIDDVVAKTGTSKAGKPYTQYTVKAGGTEYKTFSKTVAEEAKKAKDSGVAASLVFSTGQYGNTLESVNGVTGTN